MNLEIINLFKKHYNNQCSSQELDRVMELFATGNYQKEWDHILIEESQKVIRENLQANMADKEVSKLHDRIIQSIGIHQTKTVKLYKSKSSWGRIAVAASILLLASFGYYFYNVKHSGDNQNQIAFQNDIAPGKNGATLTLANGKKILINDAHAGNIAIQSGVKISKTADGQIIYEITDNDLREISYNTLTTTRGEQTQLRLPDGTLVFLNAESSLKYPTSFGKSNKRQVSLTGEGYFEVAKDKSHPFIVKTKDQSVEVLGTHFNIDSYTQGLGFKTTLLEGAVKIIPRIGKPKILKPNQQAITSSIGIEIKEIDAEYEVAWKDGFFMFNNESLENIMDKLSRWYNVKVVYEDQSLKTRSFIGTINKFENISKVLNMLEKTNVATFSINKEVLTISRKNQN
ncbi:DUF4974 domain-containing protein [Pedobacter hiemivivus]|uniref:DUF4974 domain-containing protein n=1 Tax=Pedobacter hiemivivus TaxID=2530454 RepID=A0A4V5PH38_9SPHI|nr:FecR family protein [Pedobacter hiemivivus]TKC65426.1 DUF4974 domain-containing protein [Pedobacter hiemivivus]